ncbi:MAG TPA: tripartite tricarboxylate transporter substrate binding protein [Burkholderiaceae bacterium]|nr:tripartite tricarboxylate transporter substrate binding protein [Burkholderiaceae bacterium]
MKPIRVLTLVSLVVSIALAALQPTAASAQTAADAAAYPNPNRPIRLVVPFPPGGAVDTLARKISEELRKRLNGQVIVENRPGAGTIIGTEAVAKSPPDGYTLLLNAPGGIVQLPWLQKLPYDPIKELQPVSVAALVPVALIVPTTLQVGTYAQFVSYAAAHKNKMSYASLGNGSTAHIFGESLSSKLGAGAAHTPYKGDAPAMLDLVAGRIDYMFNNVASAIKFADRGDVKILAVTGDKRIAALRDAPTLAELGVRDFELVGWFSIFAPAATPRPILDKLNGALNETYQTREYLEYLASSGLTAGGGGIDQFTRQVRDDHAKWGALINANQIKVD